MQNRMNEPAASRYLKIPVQVLRRMRREKRAPTHIVINNRPYYDSVDLDEFIKSVRVEPEELK